MDKSPCYNCEYSEACLDRISRNISLLEIRCNMISNVKADKAQCGIWIACDAKRRMENGEYDWGDEE